MEELKAFFGLLVAMSIHKLPCLRDYWSSDWVFSVSAFSRVMPLNRFLDIWNNVHLSDNTKVPKPGNSNFDKLFMVRQLIDDLKTNFQINYAPHHEQALDEAMIKYKGRTSLKQYMPMTPSSVGSKCGVGPTAPMDICLTLISTLGRRSKEFNMDLVTQLSLSCAKP